MGPKPNRAELCLFELEGFPIWRQSHVALKLESQDLEDFIHGYFCKPPELYSNQILSSVRFFVTPRILVDKTFHLILSSERRVSEYGKEYRISTYSLRNLGSFGNNAECNRS